MGPTRLLACGGGAMGGAAFVAPEAILAGALTYMATHYVEEVNADKEFQKAMEACSHK